MNKQIKRVIAVFLCMVTVFGVCLSASASSEGSSYRTSAKRSSYKTVYPFTIRMDEENKGTVVRCSKNAKGNITVPPYVEEIASGAFKGCAYIEKVTLPEGLKYIGNEAFMNCTSLAEFNIPGSVENIGKGAFANTAFYKDRSNWEDFALYHDGALLAVEGASGKFTVAAGTTIIGADIFAYCDYLYQITLPESFRYVSFDAADAFDSLEALERIKVSKKNPYYTADRDGVLYTKDMTALVAFPHGSLLLGYKLHDGVKYVYDTIRGSNLSYIYLPSSLEEVTCVDDSVDTLYYDGTYDELSSLPGFEHYDNQQVFTKDLSLINRFFARNVLYAYSRVISAILRMINIANHILILTYNV